MRWLSSQRVNKEKKLCFSFAFARGAARQRQPPTQKRKSAEMQNAEAAEWQDKEQAHSRACSGEREDDVISVTPLLSYSRRPPALPSHTDELHTQHTISSAAPLNCVIIALSAGNSNLSEGILETWISAAYMKDNLNLLCPCL
jgi:hypothetical protein